MPDDSVITAILWRFGKVLVKPFIFLCILLSLDCCIQPFCRDPTCLEVGVFDRCQPVCMGQLQSDAELKSNCGLCSPSFARPAQFGSANMLLFFSKGNMMTPFSIDKLGALSVCLANEVQKA